MYRLFRFKSIKDIAILGVFIMGKKTRVAKEKTKFAGLIFSETNTTYEQDTFWGIPYGEERKVKEETEYFPMDDSTNRAIADTATKIGGKILIDYIRNNH